MENKHTSGPWTVDECSDAEGFATIRPSDGTGNGDTWAPVIATVYDDARAHMIAAAPELLTALENLLSDIKACQIETYNEDLCMGLGGAIDDARAAIAKAKGE